ncbi:fused MFS/spermidine synthase [Nocardioides sp. Root140]|uniref:fused MFS/spermidine synthase n=1 Tax=Nocardioides sp. Root140 TaxID=1736460 RepID=UPI0006F98AF7|nr:fused MFS/spermidine synthase [Nocardioides sp. Root140]KQY64726.1 hypothetical protein ASD30_07480 [Nocardioides sp. Root140]
MTDVFESMHTVQARATIEGARLHAPVRVLFTATAFSGAALLFVVQPLVAKLLLPSYGGSATVWSTSSLFFQVLLLLAYLYVHLSSRRLGHRWQPRAHVPLILLPALVLPIALPADAAPDGDSSPVLWLLRTLILMIGLPFAVVATTGPVLQKWFSWTDDPRADDPYFLFAASNLGSFVGLLAYPFLIEPTMTLDAQRQAWSIGFGIFAVLTLACGLVASQTRVRLEVGPEPVVKTQPLERRRVATWLLWAFLPSSLMLAITAHVSTDVAAIPLLWVVPLAIYLATFVAAFARTSREVPRRAVRFALALSVVAAILSFLGNAPIWLSILPVLVFLAATGYVAHARLAADRPAPVHLTHFYLVIAIGGALGGLLNGLVAPVVFDRILEYPATLVLVPIVLGGIQAGPKGLLDRRYHPAFVAGLVILAGVSAMVVAVAYADNFVSLQGLVWVALIFGLGWWLARRPMHLAVILTVAFLAGGLGNRGDTIESSRSFFGAYHIDQSDGERMLVHGNTVHGIQLLDTPDQPASYYTSPGSIGDVFAQLGDRFNNVGVIGLGIGTLAAYGTTGQHMTFFEIDPEIVRMAEDPELFTYLEDSPADIKTVVGDGRLQVEALNPGTFDLLVLDAFSSDSIPVHLLTREAFRVYAEKLAPGGVLVVHVSNRVFDLRPVVAAAADDLDLIALEGSGDGTAPHSVKSKWIVLSADKGATDQLASRPNWRPLDLENQTEWTDDYSSVLSVLR